MKLVGLLEIRKRKRYSQQKVAMDLGLSRESISYYENGKRSPDVELLCKFSKYYDVSIDYLVYGKDFEKSNGENAAHKKNAIALQSAKNLRNEQSQRRVLR